MEKHPRATSLSTAVMDVSGKVCSMLERKACFSMCYNQSDITLVKSAGAGGQPRVIAFDLPAFASN